MPPNASTELRHGSPSDGVTHTPTNCQICFDEIGADAQENDSKAPSMVTRFCSAKCPAVICASCLKRHVQVALKVPYAGALPKVRCPLCLVPVNKQQWERFLDPESVEDKAISAQYTSVCEVPCMLTCPGCHNPAYVHLPAYSGPRATVRVQLLPSLIAFIPELRRVVRRFCRHRKDTTARDVVRYIADHFPSAKLDQIMKGVLQRIADDERRATLLLAYHSVYSFVETRCCSRLVCFNCKRRLSEDDVQCWCESEGEDEIGDDNCVECRSCRIMLVKVDGCSVVYCACGFYMDWDEELQIRRLARQQLLPVDPFDTTIYACWNAWHHLFLEGAGVQFALLILSATLKRVARTHPAFSSALRRYIWRRRFRKVIKGAEQELERKYVERACPALKEALLTLVWRRRRFHRRLLTECRAAFVRRASRLQATVLKPLLLKFRWYCRFRLDVMGSLRRHFYLVNKGWDQLSEEQQELEEDEFAMFCIGLN
ncbi:hypothetical protein BBJ28_00022217 [Nothophytophthora sp. Chile5]|nr:hypothetical protein BBJ28_00022217 [Nothophytophthora sp. Chile5]